MITDTGFCLCSATVFFQLVGNVTLFPIYTFQKCDENLPAVSTAVLLEVLGTLCEQFQNLVIVFTPLH